MMEQQPATIEELLWSGIERAMEKGEYGLAEIMKKAAFEESANYDPKKSHK